jgi:hypothetical protein
MNKLGDDLVLSMAQALAHAQGKRGGSRTHQIAINTGATRKVRILPYRRPSPAPAARPLPEGEASNSTPAVSVDKPKKL